MNNEFNIVGKVSKNGRLLISGMDELNDVLSKHKNAKVVGELRFYDNGSTEAMTGYYYAKILPDVQRAYFESACIKRTNNFLCVFAFNKFIT